MGNFMKYVLCLVLAAVSALAPVIGAEGEQLPDIPAEGIFDIREKLDCQKTADVVAKLGCTILKEFSNAGKPDLRILKESNRGDGRRWVGVTVVFGDVNLAGKEFPQKSPYINLLVFGTRFSSNFHRKISFENGYAPMYIWPSRAEEVMQIQRVSEALLRNEIDEDSPAIKFARSVEMKFSPARESTGVSLLLGNKGTYLRQTDKTLYIIELGASKRGISKFWLSRIYLTHELSP